MRADSATLIMAHRDDAHDGQIVILLRDDSAAASFDDSSTPA